MHGRQYIRTQPKVSIYRETKNKEATWYVHHDITQSPCGKLSLNNDVVKQEMRWTYFSTTYVARGQAGIKPATAMQNLQRVYFHER